MKTHFEFKKSQAIILLLTLELFSFFSIFGQSNESYQNGRYEVDARPLEGYINSPDIDVVTDFSGEQALFLYVSRYSTKSRKWTQERIHAKNDSRKSYLFSKVESSQFEDFKHRNNQWSGALLKSWDPKRRITGRMKGTGHPIEKDFSPGNCDLRLFTAGNEKNTVKPIFKDDSLKMMHPAFHEKSGTLVFAALTEGGIGGLDLFWSRLIDGIWTSPVRLGKGINSQGHDCFPSFNDHGDLFFASNDPSRNIEMSTGFDIFMAPLENSGFGHAINLTTLNTRHDEYALHWHEGKDQGLLTSNRNDPKNHDIYKFVFHPDLVISLNDSMTGGQVSNFRYWGISRDTDTLVASKSLLRGELILKHSNHLKFLHVKSKNYHPLKLTLPERETSQGRNISISANMIPNFTRKFKTILVDSDSGRKIMGGKITVKDLNSQEKITAEADSSGSIDFILKQGSENMITYSCEDYFPYNEKIEVKSISRVDTITFKKITLKKGGSLLLQGAVVVKDSGMFLENTKIFLIDNHTFKLDSIGTTGPKGQFWIPVPVDGKYDYSLVFAREGFMGVSIQFSSEKEFRMDSIIQMSHLDVGRDKVALRVFHKYAHFDLTPEYLRMTQTIRTTMILNPKTGVTIVSHTDHFGSESFNLHLSHLRAEFANKAVSSGDQRLEKRIKAFGMGEVLPLVAIPSERCTPLDVAQNRRTEFYFTAGIGVDLNLISLVGEK
ncbi:MAG: hypothetical protein H6581_25370 [Bacteroidia bacterium]|nr:hypothetical protein [Bacteroidia bacterium]